MTFTEPSRRERKKDETRRRIFDAAIALFREHGFEQTTVDDITEKADVGRGTFFNYFPRKEALLAYLSAERLAEVEENAAELLASAEPAREKLHHLYRQAAMAHEPDRELARFVFVETMKRAFEPTQGASARWQTVICSVLAQGRERGELRRDLDDVRVEAVLSGVYIVTIYEWLFGPDGGCTPIADLASELRARLDLAIDGLVPRKGGR